MYLRFDERGFVCIGESLVRIRFGPHVAGSLVIEVSF